MTWYASITEAALASAQKLIGEPFEATKTGIPAHVGEQITLTLEDGTSIIGVIEHIDGDNFGGTITEARGTHS